MDAAMGSRFPSGFLNTTVELRRPDTRTQRMFLRWLMSMLSIHSTPRTAQTADKRRQRSGHAPLCAHHSPVAVLYPTSSVVSSPFPIPCKLLGSHAARWQAVAPHHRSHRSPLTMRRIRYRSLRGSHSPRPAHLGGSVGRDEAF